MSLGKSIYNKVGSFFGLADHSPATIEKTERGIQPKFRKIFTGQFSADMDDLNLAINMAKSDNNPTREKLQQVYQSLSDLHLKSQFRTAEFSVIGEPFVMLNPDNSINKEATELLEKKWFYDLNREYVRTEWHGHSLLYFWLNDDGKEIKKTKTFPREHVCPELGALVMDLTQPDKYTDYSENPLFEALLLEMGDRQDLGILKDIAKYVIYKSYSLSDWARSSEKWGDPHLAVKTDSTGEELDELEKYAANFGQNSYLLTKKDDEVDMLERKDAGTAHHIFLDFIKLMNEENSKGTNGQSATADDKSFVGAAEVQERVLNTYTKARLMELEFYHNETTIPFLTNYAAGTTDYKMLDGLRWMPTYKYEEKILGIKPDKGDKKGSNLDKEQDPKNNLGNPFQ